MPTTFIARFKVLPEKDAEFVELITPSNTTGVLHNIVQLYR